jgi:hypothetical protein
VIEYRRVVVQGLLTGKKITSSSPKKYKEKEIAYSMSIDICIGNRVIHWPTFETQCRRCEDVAIKVLNQDHIQNAHIVKFIYV